MLDYGNRLYELRKQEGYSQEEVANKLGVSRQSISLWETDQASPSMDNLIAIAKLFKVSLDELVGINVLNLKSKTGNEFPKYEIAYEEDKRIIYRRDYQYINTSKEMILFSITSMLYFLALNFFLRAPKLVIDTARIFLIIGFVLIIIGFLIYPLYILININRKHKEKNKLHIDFYENHLILNEKIIEYKLIDYFIDKTDYMVLYVIKGNRIYVPKYDRFDIADFLSEKVERRTRKKPIWKHL